MEKVTIVVSNPSLIRVDGEIHLAEIATLVPKERVDIPAKVLLASGAILILTSATTKRFQHARWQMYTCMHACEVNETKKAIKE